MGPTWGPPEPCRSQMGPMLAPLTLLSGYISKRKGVNGKALYAPSDLQKPIDNDIMTAMII